jgi:hypothetical protein
MPRKGKNHIIKQVDGITYAVSTDYQWLINTVNELLSFINLCWRFKETVEDIKFQASPIHSNASLYRKIKFMGSDLYRKESFFPDIETIEDLMCCDLETIHKAERMLKKLYSEVTLKHIKILKLKPANT